MVQEIVKPTSWEKGAATGLYDKNNREICIGDIVKDEDGFTGRVLFTNGAFRYDVDSGRYLRYNSSLLYKDGCGTRDLEVVVKILKSGIGLDLVPR